MRKRKARPEDVVVAPAPILIDRDKLIERVNKKLSDERTGNYNIVIQKIADLRREFITYEYFTDVTIQIVDLTNPKKSGEAVTVPGMGANPIELLKNRRLHTASFFDDWTFEEQLTDKSLRWQNSINQEGYYPKMSKKEQLKLEEERYE